MKLNRLVVCAYSVIAILAVMIYLTGNAMAEPKKDKQPRPDDNPPISDDGTPTFEETATPTTRPPQVKYLSLEKAKNNKEKKNGGGEVAAMSVPIFVASTEFIGFDPGDGQTNFQKNGNPITRGGGDRIFAERNQPEGRVGGGDQLHDKVLVKVTLNVAPPIGTPVHVYFRLFDPDHYSADTDFDPNGAQEPDDNVAAGGALNISGRLIDPITEAPANAVLFIGDGSSKVVTIGLQITNRQPCNNFLVLANTDQSFVDSATFDSSGKVLREGVSDGATISALLQTHVLTVWRTLYVERDSMVSPDYAQAPAPSRMAPTMSETVSFDNIARTSFTLTTLTTYLIGGTLPGQFEGGKVRLLNPSNFHIATATIVENDAISNLFAISGSAPISATKVRQLDDDDVEDDVKASDMTISTSYMLTRYDPACVRVNVSKTDLGTTTGNVNSSNVSFVLNIGTLGTDANEVENLENIIYANRQSRSTSGFWVVYLLGAYQPRIDLDADPNFEFIIENGQMVGPALGISVNSPANSKDGSLIFMGTLRDVTRRNFTVTITEPNLKSIAVVHESGHEFKLNDTPTDGSIMDYPEVFSANTSSKVNALQFSGKGLNKIMICPFPGHDP